LVDAGLEHGERQRAVVEQGVVESADVEALAQGFLGALAQGADAKLADLVAERLAGPDDVAVGLGDGEAFVESQRDLPIPERAAGLEMMDRPATRAVEQFVHAGYDLQAAAILLCESDGTPEEVDDEIARMKAVLERAGATRMTVSRDDAERLRFWSGRKAAFPAVGRISPDYYCMDGTIPRKRLGEVLTFIAAMEKKYGLRCPNVFHAGDGNLHPLILFDANDPDQLHRTEQFAAEVLEKCVEVGGTITGEHGVGVEKINQMCVQFGAPELALFHAVKSAFDPHGLLNPGKAIPTLARCSEYGGMRVHGGKLPHAELPRF